MSLIPFPDVPQVPGVPAVFRDATIPSLGAIVNATLGELTASIFGTPVWGVFDSSGSQVLFPDSFLAMDYRNDYRVSTYPQEEGGFASYNKVGTPYTCRVRMALGADQSTRQAFLAQVDSMLKGIDLYSVVTPERTYINATLADYSYRRTSRNGATMLTLDLTFEEVRLTATITSLATQDPSGADPVSGGMAQTFPVSQSTITAINLGPLQ